ncbi:MAG: 60S ribosomal export protein NMD3 [Candidatus Nanohaloarchaea archaeon]|nr:60S ribosomal export protein NMD3 [Candidatus Nanohaloarchaea archaeon]
MQKFCPQCGKETDQLFGSKGLCRDCYSEHATFVDLPDEIRFDQCSVCGNYKVENVWKEFESDEKLIYDLLRKHEKESIEMSASFRKQGEKYVVNVLMEKQESGEIVQQTQEVVLKPQKTQCKKCSRFHGGYFEAIVQLRGNVSEAMFGRVMDHAADKTNEDRSDFVSNVEERDGGYDVYVSSNTMAEAILDFIDERFELEQERSKELVGEQEGQKVYRTVISARVGDQLHR